MGGKLIAYCGLVCTECPAYIATQDGDPEKLSELAREWSSEELPLAAQDCLCSGCRGDGLLASFVGQCEIRNCALGRGVATCGHCADYPCSRLEESLQRIPQTKAVLDEIASRLAR